MNVVDPSRSPLSMAVLACASAGALRVAQDGPPGITAPTVLPPFDPARRRLHSAARPRAGAGLRAGQRARVHAGRRPRPRARRASDRGLEYRVGSGRQRSGARMIEQVQALPGGARSARWSRRRSIRRRLPQPAAGDLVGRLCRHGRAAAGDLAPERAAISDRQGAGRCRGRLHPRPARRQGQGRAADPRQPAVPGAALRRHARCAEGHARRGDRRRHLARDREQGRAASRPCAPSCWPIRRSTSCSAPIRSCSARSRRCAPPARRGPTSSSAASTASPRRSPRSRRRRPLQGERQPRLAGVRLCHGPARRRLARRQEHPAGDGHPADRADAARTSRNTKPTSPIPARVYADPARRDAYLRMYGNICYDTRDQYLNFPWSSERK